MSVKLQTLSCKGILGRQAAKAALEGAILDAQAGDLRQALSVDGSDKLTWWNGGKPVAMDIIRGLAFLHSSSCIHRDLKSKNILLSQVCIADLSLSMAYASFAQRLSARFCSFDCAVLCWLNCDCHVTVSQIA